MSYYWINRKELLQKAKYRYHNGGVKKTAECCLKNWGGFKKMQIISIKACQKKKKKQK